jgi:thiol-disulfide isomerase/thioredoxin
VAQEVDPSVGTPRLGRRQALVAVAGAAAIVWAGGAYRQRMAQSDPALLTFDTHPAPREFPPLSFGDEQGAILGLAALRDRTVLLNVWATWCPPCREEMPALDRLQATLGGPDFEVVAISIDAQGLPAVRTFFKQRGIVRLRPYVDSQGEAGALAALGIPITLLIDRAGREIGRKQGPAIWDDPTIMQTIRRQMSSSGA